MSRAGAGGHSGGGHSSSGHSSGGHSSSGHHVGSSGHSRAGSGHSRAGGGGFGGSRGGSRPGGGFHGGGFGGLGGMPPRRPPRPHGGWYGGGPGGPFPRRHGSCLGSSLTGIFVMLIVVIAIVEMIAVGGMGSSSKVTNTRNREKAETGVAFQNDCIVDELGWFDNVASAERSLQYFYNKTGVQPYIVLKAYDSSLTTDSAKDDYADSWYTENIDNEGTLLYMYFAEEDADNEVGYMTCINGTQITAVMDSEALEIFWAYIDEYWYSDLSTDDLFETVFTKTADTIMEKSTTAADVAKMVVILLIVVAVIVGIVVIMKIKRKNEKERAEETERILKTPLSTSVDEDLTEKYTEQ